MTDATQTPDPTPPEEKAPDAESKPTEAKPAEDLVLINRSHKSMDAMLHAK